MTVVAWSTKRSQAACLAVTVAVAAVAAVGCGGGNTGTGPAGAPTASAPEATAPPTDATEPGTTAATPPPAAPTEPGSGDGEREDDGGAQSVRVPASFVIEPGGRLTPPTVTVPPFLAVELSVRADDGRAHRLVLRTTPLRTLRVGAGERAATRIRGLRPGRYPVLLDGRRAGALVAGGEVGP